jgi:hypothetical protein
MPPRFDRDSGMHNVTQMMGGGSGGGGGVGAVNGGGGGGAMCNGNGGLLTNGNVNSNGLMNNMAANGPIGTVSASLRKPLLEINGLS